MDEDYPISGVTTLARVLLSREVSRGGLGRSRKDDELLDIPPLAAATRDLRRAVRGVVTMPVPRAGVRVISFAGGRVRVELQVSGNGPARMLTGRLVPAGGARIEIRHVDHITTVAADARGRFTAAAVPAGSMSLRCHLDAPGHPRALATPWLSI